MKEEPGKQLEKVKYLTEWMQEEMREYTTKFLKYEEWRNHKPLCRNTRPEEPSKENLKRIMMMLRKETIKLEKML